MTFPIVVRVDRLRAVLISAKGGGRCYIIIIIIIIHENDASSHAMNRLANRTIGGEICRPPPEKFALPPCFGNVARVTGRAFGL